MHFIRKRKADMMDDIFDQFFVREKMFCPKLGGCSNRWKTENSENNWNYKIDLKTMPTEPEDLKIKMDCKTRNLAVSGKSEVEKMRKNGIKIKSCLVTKYFNSGKS